MPSASVPATLCGKRPVQIGATYYPLATPMPVLKCASGLWTHPALPPDALTRGALTPWLQAQGLELVRVALEDEAEDSQVVKSYFEQGNRNISEWEPRAPTGEGWFVLSIHDTETGPVCLWGRRCQTAADEGGQSAPAAAT